MMILLVLLTISASFWEIFFQWPRIHFQIPFIIIVSIVDSFEITWFNINNHLICFSARKMMAFSWLFFLRTMKQNLAFERVLVKSPSFWLLHLSVKRWKLILLLKNLEKSLPNFEFFLFKLCKVSKICEMWDIHRLIYDIS